MKTTIKYIVAVVLATSAIVSCNKKETEAPVSREVHFALKATSPETKTGIVYDQGTYIPYFQKGDEIGLFVNSLPTDGADMTYDAAFANTEDDGKEALFEGTLDVAAGDVTFYSFYPASAGKKVYVSNEIVTFGLDVPSAQHPAYDTDNGYTFDPKADILIAKPATATVDASHAAMNTVDMYFARLSAVLRLCVNAVDDQSDVYGERIKSVKIETTNGDIAGRIVVNPLTGEVTKVNSTGTSKSIEAIIEDPDDCATYIGYDGSNNVFIGVAPVSIPTGATVTFTINTVDAQGKASHKIVKTVPELGSAIVFESSKPTVINLTIQNSEISDADEEDTTNYAGEWVIAGTDTNPYVLSKYVSGNIYPASEALSIDNDIVKVGGSKADYKVTITKVTSGTYAGMYTIKDAGDKYLTAYSTSSNYLKGVAESDLSVGSYWNISATGGVLTIIASKFDGRNEIRVNHNNGSPRFSCYASTSSLPKISLYPYTNVVETLQPAATPVIAVDNNIVTISCSTEGASIYYELGTTEENTVDPDDQSTLYDSNNKPVITANAFIKAVAIATGYENSAVVGQALTYEDPNEIYYVKVTEAPSDWSGDYLIVYDNGASSKVLSGVSSNIGQAADVTITNSKIVARDYSSKNVVIAPSTTSGKYTMKMGNVFLAYTSTATSGSNNLYTVNSATSNGAEWTLSVDDAQNVYNNKRYLRYNTGSPRFCCYTSGQAKISFFKLEDNRPVVATPTFSVNAGEVNVGTSVTISCTTDGATIHYTTDGSDPTSSNSVYSSALSINDDVTIKAIAVKEGCRDSEIASASYTVPVCATPSISIDDEGKVTITCTTDGASIHYTTDNTTPNISSPTYSVSFSVSNGMTVKAIAIMSGYKDSAVASKTYSTGGGSYTLDKDDFTSNVASYATTEATITASDGSEWAINGYGATVKTSFTIGKGGANYITTPNCPSKITSIVVNVKGNTSYYLTVKTANGETEILSHQYTNNTDFYEHTFDLSAYSYTQVRLVSRREYGTSNAAGTFESITVNY